MCPGRGRRRRLHRGPERDPTTIANPIYREVIPRVLATRTTSVIATDPRTFVVDDGRLDLTVLLNELAEFWRANGDILVDSTLYHEAAPQLVLMAFLQKVSARPAPRSGAGSRSYGPECPDLGRHCRPWLRRAVNGASRLLGERLR
jgi:hypothetical protein